jgi:ligand-binding sensor domain-containing protein
MTHWSRRLLGLVGIAPAVLVLLGATACAGSTSPPGELWYASPALCAFSDDQLQQDGDSAPAVVLSTPALSELSDVAIDGNRNAWVVGVGSDDILRLPADQLASHGQVSPDLIIRSSVLSRPGNLVFDANGSLWVANRGDPSTAGDGSLLRFDIPGDATGLLNLDPSAQLSSDTPGDLFQLGSLAFDYYQNLWVTSFTGILRFDQPASASGQVTLTPGAVIEASGYDDDSYFYSVAFDGYGTLISASGDELHHLTRLTAFAYPGALSGRSSPTPTFMISGEEDLLPAGGLAFDDDGSVWMATGVSVLRYADPSALTGTVDVAPTLTLGVTTAHAPSTNSHLLLVKQPVLPPTGG